MMCKKKSNEIKESFNFQYTELTAIEEYLEQKESQGIRLKNVRNDCFIFEKSEPREIRYSAEIFRSATPSEFKQACLSEGWEYVGVFYGELYIMRTQKEDAIDIMTDDKEKMKAVAKRALFKPGFFARMLYIINITLRAFRLDFDDYFADIDWYILSAYLVVGTVIFMAKEVTDFLRWLIKTIYYSKTDKEIKYLNLKQVKRKRKTENTFWLIFETVFTVVVFIADSGYFSSLARGVFYGIVSICMVSRIINIGYSDFEVVLSQKEVNQKRIITCIVSVLVVLCLLLPFGYSTKKAQEVSKYMIDENNIPLTLVDLGYSQTNCVSKLNSCSKSMFAQYYEFESDTQEEELCYNVFVSDCSYIREKYIESILKKYEKRYAELKKVTYPDTSWDVCYYGQYAHDEDEEIEYYAGLATKDNIVLIIKYFVKSEEDAFEVAYENFFYEMPVVTLDK